MISGVRSSNPIPRLCQLLVLRPLMNLERCTHWVRIFQNEIAKRKFAQDFEIEKIIIRAMLSNDMKRMLNVCDQKKIHVRLSKVRLKVN